MASPLGSLIEGFGKGFDISDTASAAAAFRAGEIQKKRLAIEEQTFKLQEAKKVQGAFTGLAKALEMPPESPFKELAVKALLRQAGIKIDSPEMEKWSRALAKSTMRHRAFIQKGFEVRLRNDVTTDFNDVAHRAAINPAEFNKETTRLIDKMRKKDRMTSALRAGGAPGSIGQLKAAIKIHIDEGDIVGATELQGILKSWVDREAVEAGETRAEEKHTQELAFGETEEERKADAATQESVLKEIEISQKSFDLEQAEFNAQFVNSEAGNAEKSMVLAVMSGDKERVGRAQQRLEAVTSKIINDGDKKGTARTIRTTRDGVAMFTPGRELADGTLEVLNSNGKGFRPIRPDEFIFNPRGSLTEGGVSMQEQGAREAISRFAPRTFTELSGIIKDIEGNPNLFFGAGGAVKKSLAGIAAPFRRTPLFPDLKALGSKLNAVRATLAETFKADPKRFNEKAREDAKALIPTVGQLVETRGGAVIMIKALQAILINRTADVFEGRTDLPRPDINPVDIANLVKNKKNPTGPLSLSRAARILDMLFPAELGGVPEVQ